MVDIGVHPLFCHAFCSVNQVAKMMQHMDESLKFKINELVIQGVYYLGEMRRHLKDYVETVLFKGADLPSRMNTRYYPTDKDILNHIQMAIASNL